MRTKELGTLGEEEACRFLKRNRWRILHRNYQTRSGEIDIIGQNGNVILFVEVKTRMAPALTKPWEAVGFRKRKNLKTTARLFLQEHPYPGYDFRFDVISILIAENGEPDIEWIQNAF